MPGPNQIQNHRRDVHVTAELGFLLGAMKGMIEAEIHRELDENFG